MTAQLDVTLHGRLVATITNIAGDINVVAIERDFADDPNAPTLSFKAFRDPVTGKYRDAIRPTRTRAHPYFANLLPEGPMRAYLAERANVKPVRDFPLLGLLGADLPGALVMLDHDEPTSVESVPDPELAEIADDREKPLRFSLAGVQLKFSAAGTPQRGLTIPAGGLGGSWIVKLPDQRFIRVPENEYAMMTFARMVGIDVPEVGLVDPNDVAGIPSDMRHLTGKALYIKRFDRLADGSRVHTEDFAQANGLYPEQKYTYFNFDRLGAQVAEVMGGDAALDLVQRIVFTIGIGNGDMHAKNWSAIYRDGRTPSLAPAYDYVSTVVYVPGDDMGMTLAGTKKFSDVDDALIARFASRMRMPRKPVLDAAHDMVDRMREAWPQLGEGTPLMSEHRALLEAHIGTIPLFGPRTALARR
jgi:serine/threonine-protein kinase HipA